MLNLRKINKIAGTWKKKCMWMIIKLLHFYQKQKYIKYIKKKVKQD